MDEFLKRIRRLGGDTILAEIKSMARSFIKKPAVAANIQHLFFPKKTGAYSVQKVQAAIDNANWIFEFLKKNQIQPNRIGIDGLPGSGKSTLAEVLSVRLKLHWVSLDYQLPEGDTYLKQNLTIYEHHRLLRTQLLDAFDLIVFIDLPTEKIKEQIIERGQGALNIELFDYELMQMIGKAAFDLAGSEPIRIPGTDLLIKIKPSQGFALNETLIKKLTDKGFEQVAKLTQEEKLFLLVKGEARKGLSSYHQGGKYALELFDKIKQKILVPDSYWNNKK